MWVADLADSEAVGPLALHAWDALGGIDVLVNNAAIPKRRVVTELDPDDVESVMRVNFFAPMRTTWPCCRECRARDGNDRQRVQRRRSSWESSMKVPTLQANSPCAGGVRPWPSICTAPA